jgi:hypothetical protein
MVEAVAELDAGDPEVLNAIVSLNEGPREPPVEGESEPAPDEETPDSTPEGEEGEEKAAAEDEEKEEGDEEATDIDDLLVEITVNGQNIEVPLRDLKQNFSGNKFIEQNVQKAVEIRKAVEYNAAALYQANQEVATKLQSLNAVLDTMSKPNIDWADLKARNPNEYLLRREELREIQDRQQLVAQEVERINGEQAALQSQARQRMVFDQAQRLAEALPAIADPKTAPVVMDQLVRTAEYCGIPKAEVENVIDHRHMLVLSLAAEALQNRYQRSQVRQKANGEASAPQRKVVLRPGSSQGSAASQSKRLTAEIYNRAMKTGSVEDVAKTLIMSAPRRR